MEIKMYTKAMCFPFEEVPYEKIMCAVYNSIEDINMVDREDISKIALLKDTEVSYPFGDTDGDKLSRKPAIALFTAAKAVFGAMRLAGEDEETIRKYKINVVIPAMKRHH